MSNKRNYINWDVHVRVWLGEKFNSLSYDYLLELTAADNMSAIEFAHFFFDPANASIIGVGISDRRLFTDLVTIPSLSDS